MERLTNFKSIVKINIVFFFSVLPRTFIFSISCRKYYSLYLYDSIVHPGYINLL